MTAKELAKERQRRLDFMRAVYDASGRNELNFLDMKALGGTLGFDKETTYRIAEYLDGEGLVNLRTSNGITITHAGIVEVENAIQHPDRPTSHFPAINVITVGTMTNSAISQASPASVQTQSISLSPTQLDEVAKFVERFRQVLPDLNLSTADQQEAEAELKTAEAQANSTKPKFAILQIVIGTLRDILVKAGASALKDELLKHLPHFS